MITTPKILIVDDEKMVRMVMRSMLERIGYFVVEACNGCEGLAVFANETPDIVFTDLMMPEMNGMTFIARLKEQSPDTPIVVISGTGNVQSAIEAIRVGAWDYVTKPVETTGSLEIVVQRVLERARLISENRAYQEQLEELVKQRTQELHDSEVRFRTLFETANDSIILMRDEQIISCNPKTLEFFGCSQGKILERSLLSFSPEKQPGGELSEHAHKERMKQALSGEPQFYEWQHSRYSGEVFDAEISLNRLELHGKLYLQAIMRDITERNKAGRALLDNARIKRDLEIAQEIQQSLLPARPPEVPGLLVACRCAPASNVGGDYYDFFSFDFSTLDVVIADVAGHSFGSALLMAEARSVLHAKAHPDVSPGRLLAAVNDLLHEDLSRAELQISMFHARLDMLNHTLTYANAGQTRPLLFRARDSSFEELDSDGLLMGVRGGVCFEEKSTALETGDILLLHTDGVTEAENIHGVFFGVNRLSEIMGELRNSHPEEIVNAIFRSLAEFTGSKPLADDVSIAVLKVVPSTRGG